MSKGNPPVDKFQDYPVEVALFERQNEQGTWHSAQVSKTYKQGDEYKKTNNFSRNDLLKLNALVPQAIARMQELEQGQSQASAHTNGLDRDAIIAAAKAFQQEDNAEQSQDDGLRP